MQTFNRQSITPLLGYSAEPANPYRPATIEELREIEAEIRAAEESSLQGAHSSWESDIRGVEAALELAAGGVAVYVAQDEDGFFFARQGER